MQGKKLSFGWTAVLTIFGLTLLVTATLAAAQTETVLHSFKAGKDGFQLSGTEVIGWDPTSRSIRSWVFDSDGSFGQAVWTRRGRGLTLGGALTG